MSKNLYVGNLSFSTTEDEIGAMFANIDTPDSIHLVMDQETGRSRGFAFVEMSNDSEAQQAITALDGAEYDGRKLTVNEARPKEPRAGGGGGGRGPQRGRPSNNRGRY